MKNRVFVIVLSICLLGMAISTFVYLQEQKNAAAVFAAELNVNSLNRLSERGETFLVYFYGRACEDCAASEPYLLEAIRQLKDSGGWPLGLPIYRCEREANATVRSLYNVEQTPTLMYFRAGVASVRLEGPLPGVAEYSVFFTDLE